MSRAQWISGLSLQYLPELREKHGSTPGVVYVIKHFFEQGEDKKACLLVSVLILLPFAQFSVVFNAGQLILLYLGNSSCRNLLTNGKTVIVPKLS